MIAERLDPEDYIVAAIELYVSIAVVRSIWFCSFSSHSHICHIVESSLGLSRHVALQCSLVDKHVDERCTTIGNPTRLATSHGTLQRTGFTSAALSR